jgi:hypothetical protein
MADGFPAAFLPDDFFAPTILPQAYQERKIAFADDLRRRTTISLQRMILFAEG